MKCTIHHLQHCEPTASLTVANHMTRFTPSYRRGQSVNGAPDTKASYHALILRQVAVVPPSVEVRGHPSMTQDAMASCIARMNQPGFSEASDSGIVEVFPNLAREVELKALLQL
jgi:hypothetical protein